MKSFSIQIDGDTDVPSVQQEFAAALYQLMTQTRRKEENDLHNPEPQMVQENGNNEKLNTVVLNNRDQSIISNGVSKQMTDGKLNVEQAVNATKNMNGIRSIQGNQYSLSFSLSYFTLLIPKYICIIYTLQMFIRLYNI